MATVVGKEGHRGAAALGVTGRQAATVERFMCPAAMLTSIPVTETEQLSLGHDFKFPVKRMYDPIWSSYLLLGHTAGTRDEGQEGPPLW